MKRSLKRPVGFIPSPSRPRALAGHSRASTSYLSPLLVSPFRRTISSLFLPFALSSLHRRHPRVRPARLVSYRTAIPCSFLPSYPETDLPPILWLTLSLSLSVNPAWEISNTSLFTWHLKSRWISMIRFRPHRPATGPTRRVSPPPPSLTPPRVRPIVTVLSFVQIMQFISCTLTTFAVRRSLRAQ